MTSSQTHADTNRSRARVRATAEMCLTCLSPTRNNASLCANSPLETTSTRSSLNHLTTQRQSGVFSRRVFPSARRCLHHRPLCASDETKSLVTRLGLLPSFIDRFLRTQSAQPVQGRRSRSKCPVVVADPYYARIARRHQMFRRMLLPRYAELISNNNVAE